MKQMNCARKEVMNTNCRVYRYPSSLVLQNTDRNACIPQAVQDEIDKHWNCLIAKGAMFTRDQVFTVSNIDLSDNEIVAELETTDYAHLLFTKANNFCCEYPSCTIASIAILKTSDDYLVLGKMNAQSAFPLQCKFIGGGLCKDDLVGDSFSAVLCAQREIREEIGIDIFDSSICSHFEPRYIVTRGVKNLAFLGICIEVDLKLSKEALFSLFKDFKLFDEADEVCALIAVKLRQTSQITELIGHAKADYVDELLDIIMSKKEPLGFDDAVFSGLSPI